MQQADTEDRGIGRPRRGSGGDELARATVQPVSYAELFASPVSWALRPPSRVDAVCVPTARNASMRWAAAGLASALEAPLVLLCSRRIDARRARQVVAGWELAPPPPMIVVEVDDAWHIPAAPVLECWQTPFATAKSRDIAVKRNFFLRLGRAAGWQRILCLDDDIHGLTPRTAGVLASLVGPGRAVAAAVSIERFKDNSVVRHARRLVGEEQMTGLSGGAMVIAPDRMTGFYPPIYNEDWIALFEHIRDGEVSLEGTSRQGAFNPFRDPQRAADEEPGDILAEGLLEIVRQGQQVRGVGRSPEFWASWMRMRRRLIHDLAGRLAETERCSHPEYDWLGDGVPLRDQALVSLYAAAERHDQLRPADFVRFIDEWQRDLGVWREHLRSVTGECVAELLQSVGAHVDEGALEPIDARRVPTPDLRPPGPSRSGGELTLAPALVDSPVWAGPEGRSPRLR